MTQKTVMISSVFNDKAKLAADEELKEDATTKTKREIWEDMGTELEISGYPKHKISVKIQNTIEEILLEKSGYEIKINTRHFYRTMEKNNWQDESYARNKKTDALRHLENSSIYSGNNSEFVKVLEKIGIVNKSLIEKCKGMIDDDGNPYAFKDHIPKDVYEETLNQLDEVNNMIKDEADYKTKIPQRLHHIFKLVFYEQSGMFAIAKAFAYQKLVSINHMNNWLTKKQANKFKVGEEPNQLPLYKPRTRESALFAGFFGQQCEKCKSWRVKETVEEGLNSKLICIDCESRFNVFTVHHCKICQTPLYKETIQKMIKNKNTCIACKNVVNLPVELIKFAK